MENSPLLTTQVLAVGKIEYLISVLYTNPEHIFMQIIELADEHKIAEHKETIIYLHDLFVHNGYLENAEKFAKKFNIQTEKLDKV
jgi:hypothetical protein